MELKKLQEKIEEAEAEILAIINKIEAFDVTVNTVMLNKCQQVGYKYYATESVMLEVVV